MALETEAVDGFRAKQMVIFAAVRLVTGGYSPVPKAGLVQVLSWCSELSLIAMAFEAGVYRIGTHKSGLSRRVRVMAAEAVRPAPLRAGLSRSGSFWQFHRGMKRKALWNRFW